MLGVVPKSYPPTYREFYEGRQLASGVGERGEIRVGGADVPFGTDLLFAADDVAGLVVHVEVCEDMWIPVPPSAEAALAGATVLLNLSGSPITVGRAEDRKLLCRSASSRCLAAYVYAAAGQGESSTDLAWDGQTTIFENGVLLAETERFADGDRRAVADVDLDLLLQERRRMGTFDDNRRAHAERTGRVPPDRLHARPAGHRSRAAARRSSATRSSRPTSTGSTSTATRRTTSRSPPCSSGCGRSATRRSSSASPAAWTRRRRCSSPPRRWIAPGARAATSWASRCRASPPARAPRPTRTG